MGWNGRAESGTRNWVGVLRKINFTSTATHPCLYKLWRDKTGVIVIVYVDNWIIAYSDKQAAKTIKKRWWKFQKFGTFEKTDLLPGNRVGEERSLSQEKYVERMLKEFNMANCKPAAAPMEPGIHLEKSNGIRRDLPYQDSVGSLMYAALATRHDIMFQCHTLVNSTPDTPRGCRGTWRGPWLQSWCYEGMKAHRWKVLRMVIGLSALWIGDLRPVTSSSMEEAWSAGSLRSRGWWCCQQQKLSTWPRQNPWRKPCTCSSCWRTCGCRADLWRIGPTTKPPRAWWTNCLHEIEAHQCPRALNQGPSG